MLKVLKSWNIESASTNSNYSMCMWYVSKVSSYDFETCCDKSTSFVSSMSTVFCLFWHCDASGFSVQWLLVGKMLLIRKHAQTCLHPPSCLTCRSVRNSSIVIVTVSITIINVFLSQMCQHEGLCDSGWIFKNVESRKDLFCDKVTAREGQTSFIVAPNC